MTTEPIDPRTHRVLSGVSRVAVLEVVRADGPLDVQAISKEVGLHQNTVRSHLEQLIEAGLVESAVSPRATPGRPRLHFFAPAGAAAGPQDSYRMLAGLLAGAIGDSMPDPGAAAAAMGRRWGQEVARSSEHDSGGEPATVLDAPDVVGRIVALLDDVGFDPAVGGATGIVDARSEPGEPSAAGAAGDAVVIELRRCPFVDVAREHTDVVCAVHLGLMQGALAEMQAPPTALHLEPFVRPDLCLVRVEVGRETA